MHSAQQYERGQKGRGRVMGCKHPVDVPIAADPRLHLVNDIP